MFSISEGIDGSVTSYTFNLTYSNSNCGHTLKTVPVSSCKSGTCNYTFDQIPFLPNCSANSSHVILTVYGSNILGSGLPSNASYICMYMYFSMILFMYVYAYIPRAATINEYLQVSFDPSRSRFSCLFAEGVGIRNGSKSCNIVYGLKDPVTDESNGCFSSVNSVKSKAENTTNSFMTYTVTVYVPTLTEFCFVAIGTVATFSVAVEGTFKIGNLNSYHDNCLSSYYTQ